MRATSAILSLLLTTSTAFTPVAVSRAFTATSLKSVPLAGGMSFDRVCREWRCKYTGDKTDSASLAAVAAEVEKVLPAVKGLSANVKVNRLVCGACLDFKLMITQDLDDYGPWSEKDHAPEADFIEAIKGIEGISQVETQTITNMEI
ncbi:hypothetical protein TL16_g07188, partial [Triparma laevis f. inornata]|uniref:Uncharacterized protein n=2 Tax=Triparma laevis TaxID=1534972 RepID=A0A9W6ZBU8_9STRA